MIIMLSAVILSSLVFLKYSTTFTFASYICVPLEIMSNNAISKTPIGKMILKNDYDISCQLYLMKYNTTKELYETSLVDPWVDRHKHLLYRHFKLSYPNYDIVINNTNQFKVFMISDSVHLIKPLRISTEDINRILHRSNCKVDNEVNVFFPRNL